MAKVFIGVDPHKLSATIEVVDEHETVLATGRFGTDKAGYAAMRKTVSRWPERVWAVEGSNGAGRPLAQRLLADGEHVVDVPAKLSARARLFDTGHNRKTDAHDAHAVAVVAVRTAGLRVLSYDVELEALRMLADRREELTRARVQTVNRLQRLLSELTPGQAKKDITAGAGQGDPRLGAAAGPGREDPPPARGRAARRAGRGREEDQGPHQGAQGDGPGPRLDADGPARRRTRRRGPDPGRRRRRGPVRRPEPVRVLDRHRTPGRLLRRADPAPAVPGREPEDEPHAPHRRGHPDPARHPRPGLLPAQARRRQDPHGSHALPEATDLRRRLPPARRRRPSADTPHAGPKGGPGRALRGVTQESSAVDLPPHIDTSDQPLPGPAHTTLQPPPRAGRPARPTSQTGLDNRGEPV